MTGSKQGLTDTAEITTSDDADTEQIHLARVERCRWTFLVLALLALATVTILGLPIW